MCVLSQTSRMHVRMRMRRMHYCGGGDGKGCVCVWMVLMIPLLQLMMLLMMVVIMMLHLWWCHLNERDKYFVWKKRTSSTTYLKTCNGWWARHIVCQRPKQMHEAFFANSTDVHLQRKRIKMKRFSQQTTNNTEPAESFTQMFSDHGIPSGMSTFSD